MIVTSKGPNVDDVKQSWRIASIREMSGHRDFRLNDEVAGLKCVCAASLAASRILIGEHSSEPMRAAGAAPAMCVRLVTAPPRGLAQCVDSHSDGVQVSEATAMLAPSGWAFIAERPAHSEHRQGCLSPFWGMGVGPEIATLAQSLQWSRRPGNMAKARAATSAGHSGSLLRS